MENISKILTVFILFFLVGCNLGNTPTSRVEDKLSKYQMLDRSINIESDMDIFIEYDNLNTEEIDRIRKIIEKQYKNLVFEVKDEVIDGNNAVITVEIEVLDYKKIFDEYNSILSNDDIDDLVDKLEKEKDSITYTIDFNVNKNKDGKWILKDLDNTQRLKILGMY